MKSLFKIVTVFALMCALATVVHFAVPEINQSAAAIVLTVLSLTIPHKKNILAANGIEAREDFINVVKIFDNAFNPRVVFNPKLNAWVANPTFDPMWDAVSAFRLTQQTVRMEQPMIAGTTLYNFPILNNIQNQSAGQNPTEIRLAQQDTFVPTHVGFFLVYGDAEDVNDNTFKLNTYPNQVLSAQPTQETAFYNGWLNIMINNVQYTSNWDLWRHWKTNQTQQTAALGAGSPEDQLDGSEDGWYPMQPFVLMIGTQNIKINITLPQNPPNAVTAGGRLVLMFRGVLGQNSTAMG